MSVRPSLIVLCMVCLSACNTVPPTYRAYDGEPRAETGIAIVDLLDSVFCSKIDGVECKVGRGNVRYPVFPTAVELLPGEHILTVRYYFVIGDGAVFSDPIDWKIRVEPGIRYVVLALEGPSEREWAHNTVLELIDRGAVPFRLVPQRKPVPMNEVAWKPILLDGPFEERVKKYTPDIAIVVDAYDKEHRLNPNLYDLGRFPDDTESSLRNKQRAAESDRSSKRIDENGWVPLKTL